MRALFILFFAPFLLSAAQARSVSAPPSPKEIMEAARHAGLPAYVSPPGIFVISEQQMDAMPPVPYLQTFHFKAIGLYRWNQHIIFLRDDWRSVGMPILVHEMRHYAQDALHIDTSRVGGLECEAYEVEELYDLKYLYRTRLHTIIRLQQMLRCPVLYVPLER